MAKKDPNRPTCVARCRSRRICGLGACETPDPDGKWRCHAHSVHPEAIAKRAMLGAKGATVAAQLAGVPTEQRKAVRAGALDANEARVAAAKSRRAKKEEEAEIPVKLGSKADVIAFLERAATALMGERMDGGRATAAGSLARTALTALGLGDPVTPDDDVGSFEYRVVTKATGGPSA